MTTMFERWGRVFTAAALLCGLAGQAHASDSERVRAVFASAKPSAVIAVPRSFLSPDPIADQGNSQTRAEWANHLDRWKRGIDGEVEVVVVPAEELEQLVLDPQPEGACVTVFRRPSGEALSYDQDCVVASEIYAAATDWLRGNAATSAALPSLKPTLFRLLYPDLPSADVCDGIWHQSAAEGKNLVAVVQGQKGYRFTSYTVSEHLKRGTWHVVWVSPKSMEPGAFFIDASGPAPRLATVWGGVAGEWEFEASNAGPWTWARAFPAIWQGAFPGTSFAGAINERSHNGWLR